MVKAIWEKIKCIALPPEFEDEDRTRIVNLLFTTVFVLLLVAAVRTGMSFFVSEGYRRLALKINSVFTCGLFLVLILIRLRRVRAAGICLTLCQWLLIAWLCFSYGGITVSSFAVFVFVIFVSGLVLGKRWVIGYTISSILFGLVLVMLEETGTIVQIPESSFSAFATIILGCSTF